MKRLFLVGLLFFLPGAAWSQELGPEELLDVIHRYPDHVWVFLHEFPALTGERAQQFRERLMDGRLPDGWDRDLPTFESGTKQATRKSSGAVINACVRRRRRRSPRRRRWPRCGRWASTG